MAIAIEPMTIEPMTRAYAPTTAKAARAECKKTARGVFLAR